MHRYGDQLDAKYYAVQDASRLKADTLETREAFHRLVSCKMQHLHVPGPRDNHRGPKFTPQHL